MTTKISKKNATETANVFKAEYLIACQDAIIAQDQSLTLVRLIDRFDALALPLTLQKFVVVGQLSWHESVPLEARARLSLELKVTNPNGTNLQSIETPIDNSNAPYIRNIWDLSHRLTFQDEGLYTLSITPKLNNVWLDTVLTKTIPVRFSKGVPGLYIANFVSNDQLFREGWVVLSPNGQIQGGDPTGYDYNGTYTLKGDQIESVLKITRRNKEAGSVFGDLDEFEIAVSGKFLNNEIHLQGHNVADASQILNISLIRQLQTPQAFGSTSKT